MRSEAWRILACPHGFLSIQAQDFIEDGHVGAVLHAGLQFLSIQAQDFIEEALISRPHAFARIPEHSSSGLH